MAKHKYCISSRVQLPIASTWRIIVYFANILVFLITGVILAHVLISQRANITGRDLGFSFILYVVMHVGRLFSILSMYPFIRWHGVRLSWKEYAILTWSGLRGSMSVILGLIVDSDDRIDIATRDRFIFHICMMALLTLVINGTSTKFIISYLGLDKGRHRHLKTQTSSRFSFRRAENLRVIFQRRRKCGRWNSLECRLHVSDIFFHGTQYYLTKVGRVSIFFRYAGK